MRSAYATAGADGDAVVSRPIDVVPHDQEVAGKAHLLDDVELEAQTLLGIRAPLPRPVAPVEPLAAQPFQIGGGRLTLRHGKERQADLAERQRQIAAAVRDLHGGRDRVGVVRQRAQHLVGGLDEELFGLELEPVGVREHVARLDCK
jgi:hypothetical protein